MALAEHVPMKHRCRIWGRFAALALSATVAFGGEILVPGFQQAEGVALLELNAELNGFGVDGVPEPDLRGWSLVADGCDPANKAKDLGYGPFNNRWKLWKRNGTDQFAVVIRGTIIDAQSVSEDFMANTIPAEKVIIPAGPGRSIPFQLASTEFSDLEQDQNWPVAEVHAGFAYGLAAVLFDGSRGLLKALQEQVPPGSSLLVTGWSQGAAIATLLTSFLHYAGAEASAPLAATNEYAARFGLQSKLWSLKTYVFAQPKPGNWRYAMDLAEAVGKGGMVYTVNNYNDPVVQVPLGMQTFAESLTQQEADAFEKHRFLVFFLNLTTKIRKSMARKLDERELDRAFLEKPKTGGEPYVTHLDPRYHVVQGKFTATGGASLNYVPAGTVIAVRAHQADNAADREHTRLHDFLWEHHLYRYKQLAKYWPNAVPDVQPPPSEAPPGEQLKLPPKD